MIVREVTHSEVISNLYGINAIPQREKMDCVTTVVSIILGIPYEEVPFAPPVCVAFGNGKHLFFAKDEFIQKHFPNEPNPWRLSSEVWIDHWLPGNNIKMRLHKKRPTRLSMALVKSVFEIGSASHVILSLGNGGYFDVGRGGKFIADIHHSLYQVLGYATFEVVS